MNFSVLMSVYFNEDPKFLKEALDSIIKNQTITPDEIIIVKDGKLKDSLNTVLSKYEKRYPKILKCIGYNVNKGLGYALNFGLKYCSNELIFRMDTDDIAFPDRFEKQIEVHKSNASAVIFGSFIEEFNNNIGDLKRFREVPITANQIDRSKYKKNPFNHMSVGFIKSKVIEAGGYIDIPGYEDYYLWLRMLSTNTGINLNEPLVYARVGNNMIARRQGFSFLLKEINFQKLLKQEKIITLRLFIKNVLIRGLPRLLPRKILFIVYHTFLRK